MSTKGYHWEQIFWDPKVKDSFYRIRKYLGKLWYNNSFFPHTWYQVSEEIKKRLNLNEEQLKKELFNCSDLK